MLRKNQEVFEKKRKEIIRRLKKEGMNVRKGKRIPVNGYYSGIIGRQEKVLRLNI